MNRQPSYTTRQSRWIRISYRMRRESLLSKMGDHCELCGKDTLLEFDHPNGRDWEPRNKNRVTRMKLYERDFKYGNLRLLCKSCNGGYRPSRGK